MEMAVPLGKVTKNQCIVHQQWEPLLMCEIHLNKPVTKAKRSERGDVLPGPEERADFPSEEEKTFGPPVPGQLQGG